MLLCLAIRDKPSMGGVRSMQVRCHHRISVHVISWDIPTLIIHSPPEGLIPAVPSQEENMSRWPLFAAWTLRLVTPTTRSRWSRDHSQYIDIYIYIYIIYIYIYIFQMIESIINYTILTILQRPTPPRLAMAGARRWNPRRFGARAGKVPGCGGREILRRFHPDPVRISDHHCGMVNARWIQPSFHCEIVKIPAMWRISSRSILLLFQESATGW